MNESSRSYSVPALYAGVVLAIVLIVFYLQVIIPYMWFPADLLMWGETDFVGNIIRLRGGYPMYSPAADINSSTYPPLASIITYGIAVLFRLPIEVPVLRFIQLGYVTATALVGVLCWRMLREQLFPDAGQTHEVRWLLLTALMLFLAATSPDTGSYVFMLHTDAMSLLWSVCTFALLLWYLSRPSHSRLLLLSLAPAVGFLIKQYLLIWAPIAFFTLLIDNPRKIGRLVELFLVTTACTGLALWIAYLLWGPNFVFWVFEVIGGARSSIGFSAGGFEMSVPRAIDHLLRAWAPLGLGLAGGWLLLNRNNLPRRAIALWLPWLLLVAAEAMTSGTGWGALYHFGPAVVIGTLWLLVVLPEVWPESTGTAMHPLARSAWGLVALTVACLALGAVPSGHAGLQRYWKRHAPEGMFAFAEAIEAEFAGYKSADVLMDWGNWIYLRDNHLALDRAIAMGDFPTVGRYDLIEPLLNRIRERKYRKIILHDYQGVGFNYDWGYLEQPTGVRAALEENYREVRVIKGLPDIHFPPEIQFGGDVSVLVPREDADSSNTADTTP